MFITGLAGLRRSVLRSGLNRSHLEYRRGPMTGKWDLWQAFTILIDR
jgi:hypothetical protein